MITWCHMSAKIKRVVDRSVIDQWEFRMSSNSQSEASNLPKALAADLKKFDKAELQKTKTEEKILTPSLAAAGKPIRIFNF